MYPPPPPAPVWPATPPPMPPDPVDESAAASADCPAAPPMPGPPSVGCSPDDEQALAPAPATRLSRNRRRVAAREGSSDDRGRDMGSLRIEGRLRATSMSGASATILRPCAAILAPSGTTVKESAKAASYGATGRLRRRDRDTCVGSSTPKVDGRQKVATPAAGQDGVRLGMRGSIGSCDLALMPVERRAVARALPSGAR